MAAIAWERVERQGEERVGTRTPLQLVTAPPSRRRPDAVVYRRRRLVALVVGLVLVVGIVQLGTHAFAGSASAGAAPSAPQELVAQPGDSYWSLAASLHRGGDLRSVVDELVAANGGGDLRAGDRIVLPD